MCRRIQNVKKLNYRLSHEHFFHCAPPVAVPRLTIAGFIESSICKMYASVPSVVGRDCETRERSKSGPLIVQGNMLRYVDPLKLEESGLERMRSPRSSLTGQQETTPSGLPTETKGTVTTGSKELDDFIDKEAQAESKLSSSDTHRSEGGSLTYPQAPDPAQRAGSARKRPVTYKHDTFLSAAAVAIWQPAG